MVLLYWASEVFSIRHSWIVWLPPIGAFIGGYV